MDAKHLPHAAKRDKFLHGLARMRPSAGDFAPSLDYETLDLLRQNHPAWRLLRSDHAPLRAAFLQRAFLSTNRRILPQADIAESRKDELFGLRARAGPESFPRTDIEYLTDWAEPSRGWLRKFYPPGSDEPHFDLTPPTEKAIAWLETLNQRSFVGTESRLLTLFGLLKQLSESSEEDRGPSHGQPPQAP